MAIEGLGLESYTQTPPVQQPNDIQPVPAMPGTWSFRRLILDTPVALLVAIVAYVACTRVVGLSHKVMHHDESLFAYYGYWLHQGNGYDYQPILHGPVLQFLSAFFFLLFGDDQFTMRLPCLLGGLAMFPVVWYWRRYLGQAGTLAALALLALSPSITYYTRFLRNDVPYLTMCIGCALCILRALQTGAPRYICASIVTATTAFCMMESSIFFFSACIGFFGVIVIADWLRGKPRQPEPAATDPRMVRNRTSGWDLLACCAAGLLITLICGWLFHRVLYSSIHIYEPLVAIARKAHLGLSPRQANVSIAGLFFIAATAFSLVTLVNFREPRGRQGIYHGVLMILWQNRWTVLASFAIGVVLYQALFTTFFTFTETRSFDHSTRDFTGPVRALTPVQIYQNTWDYWWDQHKLHRIKGPFHYYLPILLIYELPMLALVMWGWWRAVMSRPERWLHVYIFAAIQLAATFCYLLFMRWISGTDPQQASKDFWKQMDEKFHLSHGFHLTLILLYVQILLHLVPLLFAIGRRVEAFLSFWMITSLFAYSYAGEKVPWLTVHIAGPTCLLAGIQVGRIWHSRVQMRSARRSLLAVAACLVVLYQARTQHYLNFVHPHSPAERLVYNHTSPDVQEALDVVERMGRETQFGRQLPIFMQGEMAWPLHWYLRNYPNMIAPASESLDTTTRPLVMVDWTNANNDNLTQNYWVRRMKVREWWEPPLLEVSALLDIYRVFTPHESREAGLNLMQHQRALLEWRKLWHYVAYREIWIDPMNPDWSNGANEFAMGIRKDLNETYLHYDWLSSIPKRRDIPIYP
ncbi:MAG: flippase activity-associated protein Agl23 [Candidatus Sumerlaeaceae bacterium]